MPLMMQRAATFFCMFMALGKVCWKFSTFDTAVGKFALEIQRGRIRLSLIDLRDLQETTYSTRTTISQCLNLKKSFFALRLSHKKYI